jgi:hypothetical protein
MLDATTIAPVPTTNGLHYEPTTDPDSPLADSPDTPINTVPDVAVKITSGIPEVESDVRHEPFQISLDKDDASMIGTPIVPSLSFLLFFFHHPPHPFSCPQRTQSPLLTVRRLHLPLIFSETYLWQKKTLNLKPRIFNTRMLRWATQSLPSCLSTVPLKPTNLLPHSPHLALLVPRLAVRRPSLL